MAPHRERGRDQRGGRDQRHPASAEKFNPRQRDEDGKREGKPHRVDAQPPPPGRVLPAHLPPVADHSRLGQAEGDEDVDAVKDDQQAHVAPREQQHRQRRTAHDQHAVESDETVAQGGEPRRHPPVERHVGEHAGSVDETRLRSRSSATPPRWSVRRSQMCWPATAASWRKAVRGARR